ncbi:MAG: response regulator [Pirellulales bacterium]|nr:response regulator [Pirellulales bacterium]
MTENRRVLLVDDEPNVLQGYRRHLRKMFDVECGLSGAEGLQRIQQTNKAQSFAVVVSDMTMPGMNGVEFLEQVKTSCPDTVRIMLTGNADQKTATDAVNRGAIYRFLNKPCEPERLAETIESGILRYKLQIQETAMLTKTVAGSVSLMTDVLSLVNPKAFGRLSNLRRIARDIAAELSLERTWEIEMGAMLSQIGCIALSNDVLEKVRSGAKLSGEESAKFREHPKIGAGLIRRIPRLELVADTVQFQLSRCDDSRGDGERKPPLSALILRATLDFDQLRNSGMTDQQAVVQMKKDAAAYDKRVLAALVKLANMGERVEDVTLSELEEGMILEEHVCSRDGNVLVASGHVINPPLCARLKRFAISTEGVREPIRVRIPAVDSAEQPKDVESPTEPEAVSTP